MESGQKTVIIICGPTAAGKTAFAIELALKLNTKIISADSRQCFRELNIGVAKPTLDDLISVHHYFISSHSIEDEVNAEVFEQYALTAVSEIFMESDYAVMVGGTGLYIKAFCEGLDKIPETDPAIRQKIINDYEEKGLDYLQQQVQQHDPEFWQTAEQQNPQRLMRALEVVLSTGKSIKHFRTGEKKQRPFKIIKIGLEQPRPVLNERINHRVDEMVQAGLIAEAEELIPCQNLNALQTVGYRELFDHFDGKISLHTAIESIKTNTRRYAKRQMTWFKKDNEIRWFYAGEPIIDEILELLD